jgi:outer membrane protein OmpA-like peptidoglycan-associated protein/peroxiredoxin
MQAPRLFVSILLLVVCLHAKALMVGDKAPDFTLKNLKESPVNFMQANKGRYVLIHFWSPSTVKSRERHSLYNKLALTYKDKQLGKGAGLTVISVCLEQLKESWEMAVVKDGLSDVENVWDKNGLYSQIAKQYQLMKLPADFLVSPTGTIIMIDPTESALQTKLNELQKDVPKPTDLLAKLLYGNPKDMKPLVHQKVFLISGTDTIKVAETDDYGDFEFRQVVVQGTELAVGKTSEISDQDALYLAKQNGLIVSKFNRSASGFNYKVLDKDVAKLAEIAEEDPGMKLDVFSKSKDKEMLIVENVYYATGDFKVSEKTATLLNKIAETMKANPALKLNVTSHTDAKGEDASNKELSLKRAKAVQEYLVSKGVDKAKVSATGMGESKTLNRCKNDVSCSEKEHELNRRTEFKFVK